MVTLAASLLGPVLVVVVLLGPALLGMRLFAAGDLIDLRAPWSEESTVEHIQNTCVSDTIDAVLPHQLSFRERLADGDLAPLWENSASAGTILAAAPLQGVVSPIFIATLPANDASFTAWIKLIEVAVVVAGTVLWGRRIGLSAPAGVVGGFLFATSGFMVMWTNWPQTRTAAFFPLLFWAVERIVQDRTVRSALPLPVVTAALVLGGFPAVAVHAVYFAAGYAVLRLVVLNSTGRAGLSVADERNHSIADRWLRAPALAVSGGIVALGLVAFLVIPWANQLASTDLSYREGRWAQTFGFREALTTAYAGAVGTCRSGDARWGSVIPIEGISFVGAGALVLCLAAILLPVASTRMRGLRPFLLLGGGLAFAVTFLGGPLNYVIQLFPLMGGSGLHRMRAVGGLMLAMLAAIGLDAVARTATGRKRLGWLGVFLGPATLAGMAFATYRIAPGPTEWEQARASVLLGLIAGVLVAVAWAAAMLGGAKVRSIVVTTIPLVLAVEGLLFAHVSWPRVAVEQLYRETSTDQFLRTNLEHERIVGIHSAYWGGAAQVAGLRSLSGHAFVPPEWRDLLLEADPDMFASPTYHSLSGLGALDSAVLDRLSVRYGVTDTDVVPLGSFWGDGEQSRAVTVTLQDRDGARAVDAGTPLRGAVVELAGPVGDVPESENPPHLLAEAVAADGTILASGERRVRDGEDGTLTVPIAGEHLAATTEPYLVRVRAEGGEDLVVLAGESAWEAQRGGAWVGVMVAGEDEMDLVHTTEAQVYERDTAMPRFRWSSDGTTCDTATKCARLMARVPDSTVLLEPEDVDGVAFGGRPAELEVLEDGDDLQRVRVRADGPGMLVVADGHQDDWVARVDDREVPIVRADYAMKGIPVAAGEHVVELAYTPAGWGAGPWVAGASCLGLVLGWLWLSRRNRDGAGV